MIAIAILGIGLLVVAAMFPIAWGKARDLSQHTTAAACAETAETTIKLIARVDSAAECRNYTSFAGDHVDEPHFHLVTAPITPPGTHNTKVHALTLANVLAVPPGSGSSSVITEQTWLLMDHQNAGQDDEYRIELDGDLEIFLNSQCGGAPVLWYDRPQVLFHERVHPPVGPYPDDSSAADYQEQVDEWNARLDARRYGWAVFHKLAERLTGDVPPSADPAFKAKRLRAARKARPFTMYYVTLRRAPGQRFARQDEDELASGNTKAQPPYEQNSTDPALSKGDVKLPSPWLVPLIMPDPTDANRQLNYRTNPPGKVDVAPRGVPTEVLIEATAGNDDDFREFFPAGAQIIDSVNGEVYRVVKARYNDDGFSDDRFDEDSAAQLEAILTLDREVFLDDLRVNFSTGMYDPAEPPEDDRRVWVFPPAIERGEQDDIFVIGPPPVVAIEVRSMVIHPG